MALRQEEEPGVGYVAVGKVLGPWGLRGDVKVASLTDFPERFSPGQRLYLRGQGVTIERSRLQGDRLFLKLQGVDTRSQADALRDSLLEVPEDSLYPLPPGEFYRHQLVGLEVWSSEGARLGRVVGLLSTGSNDVFLVQGGGREYAIPDLRDIVQEVDLKAGRMVIEIIPGLVD